MILPAWSKAPAPAGGAGLVIACKQGPGWWFRLPDGTERWGLTASVENDTRHYAARTGQDPAVLVAGIQWTR